MKAKIDPNTSELSDDRIVGSREAARLIGLSMGTLAKRRSDRTGPPYIELSKRKAGYRLSDLNAWLSDRERR
jgi:predicted DNA-binding transcriptional regulator AlpA